MIRVSEEPIEPGLELKAIAERAGGAGAVISVLGKVRAEGDAVTALHLEYYPGVTEAAIAEVETQARRRWAIDDALIIHRVGALAPGDAIVFVCVAARHRRAAFEAADFLMDFIKTKAMFWKKEIRSDGAVWIEPRNEDYKDAMRWDANEERM